MDKSYIETVRLLLESAPAIFETPQFAMKGGTALNLFVQNMPRLSIDIDVVYTEHQTSRAEAKKFIADALANAKRSLNRIKVQAVLPGVAGGGEFKLFIERGRSLVKVEVNHVFRGVVEAIQFRQLSSEPRSLFTTDLSVPTLSTAELYGSKLVAAMDRQHPRDIFDVHWLFEGEGLTPDIVECFVCYLAGHNRPVHEVLFSNDVDLSVPFENEFQGMARLPVLLADLEKTRKILKRELPIRLTANHRKFLLGLVSGEPDWRLMRCRHLSQLPAIQWKTQNLARLKKSNPNKFAQQTGELRARFQES